MGQARYDLEPLEDSRNQEWYLKRSELLQYCMEAHDYRLDQGRITRGVKEIAKGYPEATRPYHTDALMMSDVEAWHRRWSRD